MHINVEIFNSVNISILYILDTTSGVSGTLNCIMSSSYFRMAVLFVVCVCVTYRLGLGDRFCQKRLDLYANFVIAIFVEIFS